MTRLIAAGLFAITMLIWAAPAYAAEATFFGPIVPPECNCDAEGILSAPDWGCVLQTIQNTINFTISIAVIIALFYIVYTGFLFVTSTGNPGQVEQAKTRLMNLVVGMLVLLSAWLLVDFIMKKLYDEGEFGPWNEILAGDGNDLCIQPNTSAPILPGVFEVPGDDVGTSGGTGTITGTNNCPDCVSLSERGLTCKHANSCTADPRLATRLVNLNANFEGTWRVTEGFPATVNHTNQCHGQGTCIDAGFTGNTLYNVANVTAFVRAAQGAGLRPIFETENCTLRNTLRQADIQAYCSSDRGYGHIQGNHFSVYATN